MTLATKNGSGCQMTGNVKAILFVITPGLRVVGWRALRNQGHASLKLPSIAENLLMLCRYLKLEYR
jgi:hypothetical protein